MQFQDKIILLTGAAQGIGKGIAEAFAKEGGIVYGIDLHAGCHMQGDIAEPAVLERFVASVIELHGHIDILINNAPPHMIGIAEGSWEDFLHAQKVGLVAPYYLSKLCLPYFRAGASIINLSSTRASMSQAQGESYSAAKGGLESLTHAMAISLAGKVRVNAIAPGWIDCTGGDFSAADHIQQPVGRIGRVEDISQLTLYLASEKASFITGQVFTVDGGMSKQMIYHGDAGWRLD